MGSCASKKKKKEGNTESNQVNVKEPELNPEVRNTNSKDLAHFPNFYYFERTEAILYKISKDSLIKDKIKANFPIPRDSAMAYLSTQAILLVGGVTNNTLSNLVLSLSIVDKKLNKHCCLSVPSTFGQLHEYNNWIYYVGSFFYNDGKLEQSPLMRFCMKTDKWENLKIQGDEQGFSRILNMGTCVLGNKLLLVGGQMVNGEGKLRSSKNVYSVNFNDEFKMKCEGKLPCKIIRSNIAAGNRHAIISGGVYLKTNKPNRLSFLISWNGIDYTIERILDVGIDLTERYPATYDNDTTLFISFPNIAVKSMKHQGWFAYRIIGKDQREMLKIENLCPDIQEDSSSEHSFKEPGKSSKDRPKENDQKNILNIFVKKNNSEKTLEEEKMKNFPEAKPNLSFSGASKGSSESLDSISSKSSKNPAIIKFNQKIPDGPKVGVPKHKNNKNTSDEDSSEKKKIEISENLPKIQAPVLPSNIHNKKDSFEILQRLQSESGKIADSISSNSSPSGSSSSSSSSSDSSSSGNKSSQNKEKILKFSENVQSPIVKVMNGTGAGVSNLESDLPPKIINKGPNDLNINVKGNKSSSSSSSDSRSISSSSENGNLDLFSRDPNQAPIIKKEEEFVIPKNTQYADSPNIVNLSHKVNLPTSNSSKATPQFNLKGRNPLGFLQDPQIPTHKNKESKTSSSSSSNSNSSSPTSKKKKSSKNHRANVPVLEIEETVHKKNQQYADEPEEFQVINNIDLNLQDIENYKEISDTQNQGVRVLTSENQKNVELKKSSPESQGVRVLAPKNNSKSNMPDIPKLNLRPKTSEPKNQTYSQRPKTSENFNNQTRTISLRLISPYITSRNFKSESTLLITASDHLSLAQTHRESAGLNADFGEFYEKSLSSRPILDIFSSPQSKKVRFCQTSPKIKIKCKIFFNPENLQKLLDIMSNELKKERILCPHITTRGSFYQLIQSFIQSSPLTFSNLTRIIQGMPLIFNKSDFKPSQIRFIIDRSQIDPEHLTRYQFTVAIYKAYKVALLKQN